jgi:hypothetical protein
MVPIATHTLPQRTRTRRPATKPTSIGFLTMAERSRPLRCGRCSSSCELQRGIVELLYAACRKQLRLACTSARALVNSRVVGIALDAEDVIGRPIRLHERFPRLEGLVQRAYMHGILTDSDFADFAVAELAQVASLTKLVLGGCTLVGTAAVGFLERCCPQLRHLNLAGTGGSSRWALL